MKIMATADWHIGKYKGPEKDGQNIRFLDIVDCLNHMVSVAEAETPDMVLVSGDIFNQEQVGPERYSDEMLVAADVIEKLAKIARLVVVMRGTPNHDGKNQFRVLTKMMEHVPNVEIVTSPQVISTPMGDIACIPGFDKQDFRAKFPGLSAEEENYAWTGFISTTVMALKAQCDPDAVNILMAHYTVPGCNMESGQTSFFSNFEPVIPRETLQTSGFNLVALGHIHRPQQITGLDNVFYAGAINALNFNDEGQERGFWIHEMDDHGGEFHSTFHPTPYRQFYTINWDTDDLESYLSEKRLWLWEKTDDLPGLINNRIVRLHYQCTSEQKKRLNIPMLQSDLYELGAFYVSDIEAENMIDITNRGLLSEQSDPLVNLKKWLSEKCFKDPDEIVALAEPIIAEAVKQSSTAEIHGVFKPVSISVKNYRSYKEESFDFSDISFCTINGVNGAGKSSLFMDAIVDALFEETRDGDAKSWIRGAEDARSGMIEFVFDIGKQRFRVVRTRTKSGRPTLNLSQLDEGGIEWLNLSKERIIDTQKEIEKVLGMDSMTFRSCALIMQDQYGLFLQAKKDERIAILGNLLGLGIYGVMEQDARKRLADAKRELMGQKEAVKVKTDFVKSKGDPKAELETLEAAMDRINEDKSDYEKRSTQLQAVVSGYELLNEQLADKAAEIQKKEVARDEKQKEADQVTDLIGECLTALKLSDAVTAGAKEHETAQADMKRLYPETVKYSTALAEQKRIRAEQTRYQNLLDESEFRNKQTEDALTKMQTFNADEISEKLSQLEEERAKAEMIAEAKEERQKIADAWTATSRDYDNNIHACNIRLNRLNDRITACRKQQEFLENSGCMDIANASCRFLESAKTDVADLPELEEKHTELLVEINDLKKRKAEGQKDAMRAADATGYTYTLEENVKLRIQELLPWKDRQKEAETANAEIARLTAEKAANDKTIGLCSETLSQLISEDQGVSETVNSLTESVDAYQRARETESKTEWYAEEAKRLPVYEERLANAKEKLAGLTNQIEILNQEIKKLTEDREKIREELDKTPTAVLDELKEVRLTIKELDSQLNNLQINKGTLLQKIEDIEQLQDEIETLEAGISRTATVVTRYDALKQAFSQDGVPHQIIRNIIPHITDTANNILGAMTGGTMGVEFIMEKAVKGKDGDKATLDVMIEEYGKTTLPYASKSGGEKVKASLAVILALAEIKTTAAGIQLGMLFIDEPPFLDSDGTQAYMDALETIRDRYPDVKIMAITHDDAMKARFTQSVTIIKTDDGSKVTY